MSYLLNIRSIADRDFADAVAWYESQEPGVGERFVHEVDDAIAAIAERPLSFPILYAKLRRARLVHFPYGVIFRVDIKQINVVGIVDLRRDPSTWERRAEL